MRRILIGILVIGVVAFFLLRKKEEPVEIEPFDGEVASEPAPEAKPSPIPVPEVLPSAAAVNAIPAQPQARPIAKAEKRKDPEEFAQAFVIDEGMAVVEGDVVIGKPVDDEDIADGYAKPPPLQLWRSNVIAYHIQPDLPRPERVLKAIQMFEGTTLRFVADPRPDDVMVFQESQGICKSYVGRVGGKQPLWISNGCEAHEIAHEIMHALGFIHEQNRTDRDDWVQVDFDSIDERYRNNFEKLPIDFMKVTGRTIFDFESIMMYPPYMFAKGGGTTMRSKVRDQTIRPGEFLSVRDRERVSLAYPAPETN